MSEVLFREPLFYCRMEGCDIVVVCQIGVVELEASFLLSMSAFVLELDSTSGVCKIALKSKFCYAE